MEPLRAGHAQPQKQGVTAARIELRTLVNECKVRKGRQL